LTNTFSNFKTPPNLPGTAAEAMAEKMFTDALAKGGKKATGSTGVNSGGNMLAKLKAGAKKVRW